jgi:hypothetical protein
MKRIIVDFAKLTTDILELLAKKYPNGYDYSDVISFKNTKGENIRTVEVKTEDTIYLVKISAKLEQTLEDYIDDESSFEEDENLEELDD